MRTKETLKELIKRVVHEVMIGTSIPKETIDKKFRELHFRDMLID